MSLPNAKSQARLLVLSLAMAAYGAVAELAAGLSPARTEENVQRKAVVVAHEATLFTEARGQGGTEAPFMQVYFLLEGAEAGTRVPVSFEPNDNEADGWLERRSFAEWNSLQMVNFVSQSGRELAKIFADAGCAERFGLTGEAAGCEVLGSEPLRSGRTRDDYALLVPVFERQGDTYQGGFVRVNAEGPVVRPQAEKTGPVKSESAKLGYDLVLVVDATRSMEQWFRPTNGALRNFIRTLKSQIGNGEVATPFNVGLLFYRDRKATQDCDIGYLTHWAVDLTADVEAVASALEKAQEAKCGSDEIAEAVYDALNRAIQDPQWKDGHFKVVLLVGDAPPHPSSSTEKNPLGFTVDAVTKMSEERNLRFLTFKIGVGDADEFRDLAFRGSEKVQGRFRALEPDPAAYERALLTALQEEWQLLDKANQVYQAGLGAHELQQDPGAAQAAGIDLDAYELPIIIANLPPSSAGNMAQEFVEGWVPRTINKKLAVSEYVFMVKRDVQLFVNVIETIALRAQDGIDEGSDAFLGSLRSSLAQMLNVKPEELFRSGETLDGMMRKARVLPFRTTVLSITADEVNTWKPADFERLNKILAEKTELLRAHVQKPGNQRLFGNTPHVYVPRDLFP
jgi:hypothetical protein